jgi:integration host factor subunit beta
VNRAKLIKALREETGITKQKADAVVRMFFDEMSNALAKGDRVELRGLCSFRVKKYRPYTGINPKTGDRFRVKSKRLPVFKCGIALKKRVNPNNN